MQTELHWDRTTNKGPETTSATPALHHRMRTGEPAEPAYPHSEALDPRKRCGSSSSFSEVAQADGSTGGHNRGGDRARLMIALAVDVKTAQTHAGHRNARTTPDIYAQPTPVADERAAVKLGDWFLGSRSGAGLSGTRDGREMESGVGSEPTPESTADQNMGSGGSKNRTCDLSIISAAL
jgi:hypothetical protein